MKTQLRLGKFKGATWPSAGQNEQFGTVRYSSVQSGTVRYNEILQNTSTGNFNAIS